jgi:hypothetical protein
MIIRLFLLIKAKPDIVNQKYLMFDGSERSFADLMSDDGQLDHYGGVGLIVGVLQLIDSDLSKDDDDDRLMREIYHKIRINAGHIQSHGNADCFGTAIGIRKSALTHSCRPNTGIVFKGNSIDVRVMRNISAGEEVTIAWIDLKNPKKERHEDLKEKKGFICTCDRCEAGDLPGEVAALKKMKGVNEFRCVFVQSTRLLDLIIDELPLREKFFGPYDYSLTHDMMQALIAKRQSSEPISAANRKKMRYLMRKVSHAFPITHGEDHPDYEDVKELNEFIMSL